MEFLSALFLTQKLGKIDLCEISQVVAMVVEFNFCEISRKEFSANLCVNKCLPSFMSSGQFGLAIITFQFFRCARRLKKVKIGIQAVVQILHFKLFLICCCFLCKKSAV